MRRCHCGNQLYDETELCQYCEIEYEDRKQRNRRSVEALRTHINKHTKVEHHVTSIYEGKDYLMQNIRMISKIRETYLISKPVIEGYITSDCKPICFAANTTVYPHHNDIYDLKDYCESANFDFGVLLSLRIPDNELISEINSSSILEYSNGRKIFLGTLDPTTNEIVLWYPENPFL